MEITSRPFFPTVEDLASAFPGILGKRKIDSKAYDYGILLFPA